MTRSTFSDRPSRSLRIRGHQVEVQVRESSRATAPRIRVGVHRPLEVVVPAAMQGEEIDRVLAGRAEWIAGKLAAVEDITSRPHTLGLQRADCVWLDEQQIPVVEKAGRRATARLRDDQLEVTGPDRQGRAAATERWYRRQAREQAQALADQESERLSLRPKSVAIRDQRTRWGSCSSSGALSLNWRLVIAPEHVLRYVVIHELCHLRVADHSKDFWRLLGTSLPGWREADAWLKEHDPELRAYEPLQAP